MDRIKMTRVISFRVTEKEWLDIERAAANSGENPNDWCRTITLETLRIPEGLTPNQRLLFSQISHTQYLVWVGFQLLADEKLDSEVWKYYREHARTHIEAIVNDAVKNLRSTARNNGAESLNRYGNRKPSVDARRSGTPHSVTLA